MYVNERMHALVGTRSQGRRIAQRLVFCEILFLHLSLHDEAEFSFSSNLGIWGDWNAVKYTFENDIFKFLLAHRF